MMRWVSLALFTWLAIWVGRGQKIFFDSPVRDGVHSFAAPAWTAVFEAFTFVGAPRLFWPLVLITIVAGWRHHRREMIRFSVVMAGALVLEVGLKLAFHRARPAAFFGLVLPESYSFPSGHALYAMCLYSALAGMAAARRILIWTAAALLIALIGFSRIYLGVHYPSDVVAGWAIGWFWTRSVLVFKA
jgi:undecaprenyl-diphosphatase